MSTKANHSTGRPRGRTGFRLLPWVGIVLTLSVFVVATYHISLEVRQNVRTRIANRDGEILTSMFVLLQSLQEEDPDFAQYSIEDRATQWRLVLEASHLRGVMATRLFKTDGSFVAALPFFPYVNEGTVSTNDLPQLLRARTVNHFWENAPLTRYFVSAQPSFPATAPILDVFVPIREKTDVSKPPPGLSGPQVLASAVTNSGNHPQPHVVGIAEFVINGESIAREYASLDRQLLRQSGLTFIVGAVIICLTLAWAFQRLRRSNRLLELRTSDLQQANRELALAAKTSAVGALTAHLIHGLKNPLFGLKNLVSERAREPTNGQASEWQLAAASTRRMQTLINEVVRVLQDDQSVAQFEIDWSDLEEVLHSRMDSVAEEAGVGFLSERTVSGSIPSRNANLMILILQNLLENAIQATPRGGRVLLHLVPCPQGTACEVADQGPGIPDTTRDRLFQPCHSTKENSSGIGLAISKQLANHLGATLELKESSPRGAVFRLLLPSDKVASRQTLFSPN